MGTEHAVRTSLDKPSPEFNLEEVWNRFFLRAPVEPNDDDISLLSRLAYHGLLTATEDVASFGDLDSSESRDSGRFFRRGSTFP